MDGHGNVYTLVDGQIAQNGVTDARTSTVVVIVLHGGLLFQQNQPGNWYSTDGSSWPNATWDALGMNADPCTGTSDGGGATAGDSGGGSSGSDGGAAASGPVPMMAEYSSYVLAAGGDFEFAQMASSTGVLPPGWELAPEVQIGSPSLLSNVAIEHGTGLVLTVSDSSGSGACIYTKSGFSLKAPYYREIEATLPTDGTDVVNHSCSWALTTDPPDDVSIAGEIDINEGGWLVNAGTLHNGPESALYTYGPDMGVTVGSHKYGVYVTSTDVTWYEDGQSLGTFAFPEPVPADAAWFPIETNQGGDGVQGATSPTVTGSAGAYVVAYDRWFVSP
jgi:hypothetical protein